MLNRRKIRETVLKALYATLVGDNPPEHVLQIIIKPELQDDDTGLEFAERLYLRSLDYRTQVDKLIQEHIANWEIERLAITDRVILQMAITELLSFEDIPTKVTINEAIEIAKKYSTSKSGRFVNGILDAVMLTLSEEDQLQKRGRGLRDQPALKPRVKVQLPSDTPDKLPEEHDKLSRPPSSRKQRIKRPGNARGNQESRN